jgi:hypothetical protein
MMKDYNRSILLRCVVCGSNSDFECNEDQSYIKCRKCNREYMGGFNELVELNKAYIQDEISVMKDDVKQDFEKRLRNSLRKSLKGNKYIKFE